MQWRLLAAVGGLLLVVIVIGEVRNPERWKWITKLDRMAEPAGDEDINSRLPVANGAKNDGEVIVGDHPARPKVDAADDTLSGIDRAWKSGWEETFGQLGNQDRQQIYDLLKSARDGTPIKDTHTELASEAIQRLDGLWAEYRATAKAGVQQLGDEEKASWTPVLEELELRWTIETKPLFMIVAKQEPLSKLQQDRLLDVQDALDHLEIKAIQDNTPWRASEREIWFRLLGKLQKRSREELNRGSQGRIGYAQMFKQSEAYRGKLITVRGTAEDVYWVEAPPNSYGIEKYWVYWLRPEGGANSPILVYALNKPKDFPFVDFPDLGRGKMPSKEDVEFTGFFFKRYAYQGKGGIYTAPMLLAREPEWLQSELASAPRNLPSPVLFLSVAAGLALLAAGLAAWVYYQYRPGRGADGDLPTKIAIKSE